MSCQSAFTMAAVRPAPPPKMGINALFGMHSAAGGLSPVRMRRPFLLATPVMALWALAGCGAGDVVPFGVGPDGNVGGTLSGTVNTATGEPNDTFAQAIAAAFDATGRARLAGTVAAPGDLDVYRLGSLSAGERVIVDADTPGSALDVSVALFDDQQRLTFANDDRGGSTTRFLDSRIDWVTRYDAASYYLVVTHSAFAESGRVTGTYRIDVTVTPGSVVPPPVPQVLLLDFDGGIVDDPLLDVTSIAPFRAADISPAYRDQDALIKESIRSVFEQNFERFNVAIVTTDDPPLAPGTKASTIFFGGFNAEAFGVSQSVDLYNADFCDDAIIFTESFAPGIFSVLPSATALGVAIGNVGAHEAGHLLGLNHVDDDLAIMDDQSAADAFLDDQEFMRSPLSRDIMTIGTQDAVVLLDVTVGASAFVRRGLPEGRFKLPQRSSGHGGRWIHRRTHGDRKQDRP